MYDIVCFIFVVSFGKTAKLLLSIMMWVEETKEFNSSYEFARRQNLLLVDYGASFLVNTGTWLYL